MQTLTEWGGQERMTRFKQALPSSTRLMLENVWMAHSQVHNLAVIQGLRSTKPPTNSVVVAVHAFLLGHMEIILLAVGVLATSVFLTQVLFAVHGAPTKTKPTKTTNKVD
jgi:hypothetical protein